MFSTLTTGDGGSPVWLTVIVARIVGGFGAGMVTALMFGGVANTPSAGLYVLPIVIGALCTGAAIAWLLPMMSGRTIGLFQAVIAALSGSLFTLVVLLLQSRGLESGSTLAVAFSQGATLAVTLVNWVGSLAITTWMVSSAASEPVWREKPAAPAGMAPQHTWDDTPPVKRDDQWLGEIQAEEGYWGSMQDHDPDDGSPDGATDPEE